MIAVAFLLIALAGGLGAVIRLLLSSWIGKLPWGILAANTAASFIVGYVLRAANADSFLVALVVTGLCGGLSTFSTFSAQTVEYFKAKQVWRGVINIALNFALPTLAALAGLYLAYSLLKY
jgi:fluoride exporter